MKAAIKEGSVIYTVDIKGPFVNVIACLVKRIWEDDCDDTNHGIIHCIHARKANDPVVGVCVMRPPYFKTKDSALLAFIKMKRQEIEEIKAESWKQRDTRQELIQSALDQIEI